MIPRVDAECGSTIVAEVVIVIVLVKIARIAVVVVVTTVVVIVGDRRRWRDDFGRRRWLWWLDTPRWPPGSVDPPMRTSAGALGLGGSSVNT